MQHQLRQAWPRCRILSWSDWAALERCLQALAKAYHTILNRQDALRVTLHSGWSMHCAKRMRTCVLRCLCHRLPDSHWVNDDYSIAQPLL